MLRYLGRNIEVISGLEPVSIPFETQGNLGSFKAYITDSIFPDETSISSYEPEEEDVRTDLSRSLSPESSQNFSSETELEGTSSWLCSCISKATSEDDNQEHTIPLCTVKDYESCDCVSSFGNFYSISNDKSSSSSQRQVLQIDVLPERLPLVECSPSCPCYIHCTNKVTQRGVQIPVTIRRSRTGIGLGLFYTPSSGDILPKGSFVSLYAGEYLTTFQARLRWSEQERKPQKEGEGNYILSIRLPGEIWHIDPRYKGNIGRFLNHSCDPSCVIQIVRWGADNLPRAAIFAKRDITKDEELTFDYANASGSSDFASQTEMIPGEADEDASEKGRNQCLCGSFKCRGWMPFDETL
ncbi:uncharacterized protein L201_002958 [Kwoniella dendrophila CBS 6074]|uniref:SET domain-containing protein n=1 Tax=Kwoniella dendrophila CBS 6074 TaxID=1295534 RepID=A0AAX4JTZ4_9TREE